MLLTLKSSLSTFPVTVKYADDNKSAVLSAAYLPVGDYTVAVKGTDAPFSVKIVAAVRYQNRHHGYQLFNWLTMLISA